MRPVHIFSDDLKPETSHAKSDPHAHTIARVITQAVTDLTTNGIANPRLDAEVLLAHTLGMTRTALFARLQDTLAEEAHIRFQHFLQRRRQCEPLQYITGVQEFWSLDIHVTPDVLIPRPETELLVETVLKLAAREKERSPGSRVRSPESGVQSPKSKVQSPKSHFAHNFSDTGHRPLDSQTQTPDTGHRPLRLVDVGTGSGCIAIALATELPQAEIWATDISHVALAVAQTNAQHHRVADRIHFRHGDLFAPLTTSNLIFDVIVANPPYIARNDLSSLQPEVQTWEPRLALDGGDDGLDFYRRLLQESSPYLQEGGWLVMEIGHDQRHAILQLAQYHPVLANAVCLQDYHGHHRVIFIQKTPGMTIVK